MIKNVHFNVDIYTRPAGMNIETWCSQNGISKANYYYRLRRVREAYIKTTTQSSETTFVELPVMSDLQTPKKQVSTDQPIAQIHTSVDLSIDIFPSISAEQLQSLIGAVKNVK